MEMENRDVMLHFRVSQSEAECIRKKMEEQGYHSMSAYLRKMAVDGFCFRIDYDYPRKISSLLRRCGNNLNQYARAANASGSIYTADIQDLQERLEEIWKNQKESLQMLAAFR
ncbi:MAG: MobC family plasmid mobilization relaxosome protein [Lachnospiraceae bacterium]|nr:MobC family plasmid mobilization relaxosome protein [Lachnospiraceae bacterium]